VRTIGGTICGILRRRFLFRQINLNDLRLDETAALDSGRAAALHDVNAFNSLSAFQRSARRSTLVTVTGIVLGFSLDC
jgi:hypothetical protein